MKKALSVCLLIMLFSAFYAVFSHAASPALYSVSDDGKYSILTSYTGNEAEFTVASEYAGVPVRRIAKGAFSGNVSTYKIIIPDTVEYIEPGAFTATPSLCEFEVSGNYTFEDGILYTKDKKTIVKFPESVDGSFTVPSGTALADYSFSGSHISSADLSGASSVGAYTFSMSYLTDVTVGVSVGEYAFSGSALKTAKVTGGFVGAYAFSDCTELEYADLSGASGIGDGVFFRDTALLSASLPDGADKIPDQMFAGCTSLVTAPVGRNIKLIGRLAFCGCISLEYARIGGITAALDAFDLCDRLDETLASPYSPISVSSDWIVLKTGASVIPAVTAQGGYDLFSSSSVVKVDGGTLTAVAEGTARVYAVSRSGGACRVITVTVNDGAQVIGSEHPYSAGTYSYTYKVPGSPGRIAVTFSGSDMLASSDVLTVTDARGNVYGVFSGNKTASETIFIDGDTVKITLAAEKGGAYGFRVVSAVPVSSLQSVKSISVPSSVTVSTGDTYELSPKTVPAGAFPGELVCVSSDGAVAHVSADGVIKALSAGVADITVYSPYYGVSAVCRVTVKDDAEDGFEFINKNGSAYITRYKGGAFFVEIPEKLGGLPVAGISDGAFSYTPIRTLSVPETVVEIADGAFDGCFPLNSFTVDPSNPVYSSLDGVLYTKDKKTLLRVPPSNDGTFTVPDSVVSIADGAFRDCTLLTEIRLGSGVSSIDGSVFTYCDRLKKVSGPSDAFTVNDGVLFSKDGKTLIYYPSALNARTYTVPQGTEIIAPYAFNGPVYLTGVVIPPSVTRIDERAFSDALYLEKFVVNSSNTVFSATDGVLYENGALKCVPKAMRGTFTVPPKITRIMPYAFFNCTGLEDVVFNTSVTDIGAYAFGNCTRLYALYLPQSLRRLGEDPFFRCCCLSVYIPDGATVISLSGCSVRTGKDSHAYTYCVENGIPFEFMYYSSHGLYTSYTPVNGTLRVTENTDKQYLSRASVAAKLPVKAYSADILYSGVYLPLGEYVMIREKTSSERYYLHDGVLTVIGEDAASRYLYRHENIIELYGDPYTERISVKKNPDRVDYNENEEIDAAGLVIYYRRDDGTTTTVSDGFTVECDTSSAGIVKATVIYRGCTAVFDVTVSSATLTGNVSIKGDPRFGTKLEADMSAVLPKTDSVTYGWYRDGKAISGASSASYVPVKEDIGHSLTVRITGKDGVGGELASSPVTVMKAKAQTPPKPVISSSDETSVTLKKVDGCEYRLNSDGVFSDNNVFKGLTPGASYVLYQRYKETETTEASAISAASYTAPEILKIRTDVYFLNTASGTVSLVKPGTDVSAFLKNFKDGDKLTVYKNGSEIKGTAVVGTGCEVRLYSSGKLVDSYTVVITGDVNGDGKTTITDYLQIKERILNGKALPTPREYACDVNGDGKITITDYLKLKYCIQNGESPEQNRY